MNSMAVQKLPTYIQEKVSTAVVPVKYGAAVKALVACRSIDDAKYFSDKADALAAWAKIYSHNEAAIEAKRLKLHAFRRMGILAEEIAESLPNATVGRPKGARSQLLELGLNEKGARGAINLAKMPQKKFERTLDKPHAPSYFTLYIPPSSAAWRKLKGITGGSGLSAMHRLCQNHDPKTLARELNKSEAKMARNMVLEVIEWLDTFEQYLPQQN